MLPFLFEDIAGKQFFLRTYVICMIIGLLTTIALILIYGLKKYQQKQQHKLNSTLFLPKNAIEAAFFTTILIIIGARIGYVFTHWNYYTQNPVSILYIWQGGLIFHGGLLGGFGGLLFYCHIKNIGPLSIMDLSLPYVCIGYAIGRIGCFLNGCCYGQMTQMPWGVVFQSLEGQPRHPTQLYAAMISLFIFLLLIYIYKQSKYVGTTTASFLLLFGTYRFFIEYLRIHLPDSGGLSQYQMISLVIIAAGFGLLILPKRIL